MDPHALSQLNAERRARRAVMLVTDLQGGEGVLVREGDRGPAGLDDAVDKAFRTGISSAVEVGGKSWFINVQLPPPRLVIVGAVHISQALAPMARIAGFDVEIIDPRTAFATQERFPDVTLHAEWPQDVLARLPLDAFTALAAVTHDPKIDDPALTAALDAGCFYIGALGSRKTHARRVARLVEGGLSEARTAAIRAPIGLDIGAASPAEIAVAVLAQVIEALRTRGLERTAGTAAP